MLIVKLQPGEKIEKALKVYKKKVTKSKMMDELRERKHYTKRSVKKRDVKQKAIYLSKKYGNQE